MRNNEIMVKRGISLYDFVFNLEIANDQISRSVIMYWQNLTLIQREFLSWLACHFLGTDEFISERILADIIWLVEDVEERVHDDGCDEVENGDNEEHIHLVLALVSDFLEQFGDLERFKIVCHEIWKCYFVRCNLK